MKANWIQQIDAYLRNELSTEARLEFEANLSTNAELRAELELQQLVYDGLKRMGQRQLVQQSGKIYRFRKQLKWVVASVLVATAIASTVYLVAVNRGNSESSEMRNIDKAQLEVMEKNLAFENIIPEYFEYNGDKAVFLSESGVLLSIAEGSFELNGKPYSGEAMIQWQEAQSAADIVKAGLSTVSGTKLLETQGMFSLQAFTPDGKKLTVSEKGIYVQVPVQELKEGMMLFTGVPDKNGNLDWQNPEPLEKLPVLADMKDLNFYPPGYEKKLHELSWEKDKKEKDSLYLSFEDYEEDKNEIVSSELPTLTGQDSIGSLEQHAEFSYARKGDEVTVVMDLFLPPGYYVSILGQKNKISPTTRFEVNQDPGYTIHERRFIGDVKNVQVSNNKIAAFFEHVQFQQVVKLVDKNIKVICGTTEYAPFTANGECFPNGGGFDFEIRLNEESNHIPPSKVLAIWQPKFSNTNLATRDFEKRMKAIHKTCSEKVFNVYLQVYEPIWKLDEQVAKMGYPEFKKFAAERVGKVDITDEHQQNLKQFYEESINQLKEQAKSNKDFQQKLDAAWDKKVSSDRNDEMDRTIRRVSQSLNEEYSFNMKKVSGQLGISIGFYLPPSPPTKGSNCPIVVNIDRLVMNATIARESTLISDPNTGKTVIIRYNECTATVLDATKYSKLFMYTFPDKINSFERIDAKKGKFSYNLNGDMNYHLAFIGINEKGYFYAERKNLNGGKLGKFVLNPISEKEFNEKISLLNSSRNAAPMNLSDELAWLFIEQKDVGVQRKRKDMEAFRSALLTVVYPCMKNTEQGYPSQDLTQSFK